MRRTKRKEKGKLSSQRLVGGSGRYGGVMEERMAKTEMNLTDYLICFGSDNCPNLEQRWKIFHRCPALKPTQSGSPTRNRTYSVEYFPPPPPPIIPQLCQVLFRSPRLYFYRTTKPPKNDTEHDYPVNRVMGHKGIYGVDHYYIHWKGYPAEDDNWEPVKNLTPEMSKK